VNLVSTSHAKKASVRRDSRSRIGKDGGRLDGEWLRARTDLIAVSLTTDRDTVRLGTPRRLLDIRVPTSSGTIEQYANSNQWGPQYDILPDGKRFVMVRGRDPQSTREIVLVQNWFEELKPSVR
jgi:hypothetical protein